METNEVQDPAIDVAETKRALALAEAMREVRTEAELLRKAGIDVHLHMYTDVTVEADTLQVGNDDLRLRIRCDSRDESTWKAKLAAGPNMLYETVRNRFIQ